MVRVDVDPERLRWAVERAGLSPEDVPERCRKLLDRREDGPGPTLKQAEAFCQAVHMPLAYLFLSEPPDESLPVPDARAAERRNETPSRNLLHALHACQDRQDWYRDFARSNGEPERGFVGSVTTGTPPEIAVARMRDTMGIPDLGRLSHVVDDTPDWERTLLPMLFGRAGWPLRSEILRLVVGKAEEAGVLVMISGIVRQNTRRPLDPREFSGFALADPYAPVVFVNGAQDEAARLPALVEGLARIWLGRSALSDGNAESCGGLRNEEEWCGAVAREFLLPLAAVSVPGCGATSRRRETLRLLLRPRERGGSDPANPDHGQRRDLRLDVPGRDRGSRVHRAMLARTSRRFARTLVSDTIEGRTLYRDALRMLGVSRLVTLDGLARELGVRQNQR